MLESSAPTCRMTSEYICGFCERWLLLAFIDTLVVHHLEETIDNLFKIDWPTISKFGFKHFGLYSQNQLHIIYQRVMSYGMSTWGHIWSSFLLWFSKQMKICIGAHSLRCNYIWYSAHSNINWISNYLCI